MDNARKHALTCMRTAIAFLLTVGMFLFGVPITQARADTGGSCSDGSNCVWDFYNGELTIMPDNEETPAVLDWDAIAESGGRLPGLLLAMR